MSPYNTKTQKCMEGGAFMNESCGNDTTHCSTIEVMVNSVMVYNVGCVVSTINVLYELLCYF